MMCAWESGPDGHANSIRPHQRWRNVEDMDKVEDMEDTEDMEIAGDKKEVTLMIL